MAGGRMSIGGGRGKLGDWANKLQAEVQGGLARKLRIEWVKLAMNSERESRLLATSRLHVRTGRLRQSVRAVVEGEGATLLVRLRAGAGKADLNYARIQEEGGVIRPKRGKFLTIPLGAAMTRAGVTRGEFLKIGGLRTVPGLFVVHTPGHSPVLCRSKGKGKNAKVIALFLLVKSSKIIGQHYLSDGADAAIALLPDALQGSVERAVTP